MTQVATAFPGHFSCRDTLRECKFSRWISSSLIPLQPPILTFPRPELRDGKGAPPLVHYIQCVLHRCSRDWPEASPHIFTRSCRGTAFRMSYEVNPRELMQHCRSSRSRGTPCHPLTSVTGADGKRVCCAWLCIAARTSWHRSLNRSARLVASKGIVF